jgi:hypothetical protein
VKGSISKVSSPSQYFFLFPTALRSWDGNGVQAICVGRPPHDISIERLQEEEDEAIIHLLESALWCTRIQGEGDSAKVCQEQFGA